MGVVDNLSSLIYSAATAAKLTLAFPKRVLDSAKVAKKPSYYPELPRKSDFEIWRDNVRWVLRDHWMYPYYISNGMDVKDFRNMDDYLGHREFSFARDRGNQELKKTITGSYNYIVLLRDKYAFASYLASTIGKEAVVDSVALITDGQVYRPDTQQWTELQSLLTDGSELVFKLLDGECAEGVMLVTVCGNEIRVDDRVMSRDEFAAYLAGNRYLVQNVVVQHSTLQQFKTKSVNTIRIVTIKGKSGQVGVFAAFLRLSDSADSFVDNRAKGGLGIGIDLSNGQLMKYGLPHDAFGGRKEVHSLSGIRFEGFQLPYWQETVDLVCRAHKQFYELQSIGWDVVLTEDGPVLLEGNDDWEIGGPQDTYGGLKKRWFDMVNG